MKTITLENGSNVTDNSPVLTAIHTLKGSPAWNEDRSKYVKSLSLKQLKEESEVSEQDGFGFAVSLRDGSCLYTSDNMPDHLGYPQNMLDKQCFMNFLFHKDHITFANHLTQGLNACYTQGKRDDSHLAVNTFFCRIRMYHSLNDGYSISDRKTIYKPFKITLHINELIVDDICVENISGTLCVNATATLVSSAYSVPEEIPAMTSFSTRHTSSCHFSHVDASAIPYIGYLPQDMIGFSVFDFYHTEDMPQLKDIYELVVKERGSSFRSKPYRFRIQNGCFIVLETEWSCFINPWSHKLEFVVGQHRVLKGPTDVEIFTPPERIENYFPEEIMKESHKIQKEIRNLLSEPIYILQMKKSKRFSNKRKRDLLNFVYKKIVCNDDELKGSKKKSNAEYHLLDVDDTATSDSDSVVMGDISPYRESFASETPPTVQQLRLQENIDRFFASKPKTYSDGSDDPNKNEKLSSGDRYQTSSSGSGNGSGNTSKKQQAPSPCEQPSPSTSQNNYNSGDNSDNNNSSNNNQQNNRGSNSSKCNHSSFSDSGYGKSFNNNGHNDPGASQQGSYEQPSMMWTTTDNQPNDEEAFSSCLALTEKSLSAHNRIKHKHFKQQQRKSSTRENWFQQKDGPKHKPAKISTLTQTEDKFSGGELKEKLNPFMFSPMNGHGSMPTPFFIPVMYMSSMPYYPTTPNAQPNWPFGSAPPISTGTTQKTDLTAEKKQFPVFPSTSAGYPQSAFSKFAGGDDFRAPSAPCKPYSASLKKNSRGKCKNLSEDYGRVVENFTDAVDSRTRNVKSESAESEMQTEQSPTSSYFTRSSSFQSTDKDEDMDCEKDKHPISSDSKAELPSEIAFRYQMDLPNIEDTLMKDREVLKSMQQPELVNQQLLLLQGEREEENDCKLNVGEGDFNITEEIMLGLATEDEINDEMEKREEYLLHLMCED